MASQYFAGLFSELLPNASISDITPPTFAGITSVTPNSDGSFTLAWSAATDATTPIIYNLYIALGSVSAAALFVSSNLVTIAPYLTTSKRVFTLGDQTTYIVNGSTYTFGVRAIDAVGNLNTNTAILTSVAIGSGNLPVVFQTIASNLQATELLLAADHVNFQADHTNFQTDHTNFQADHTAFQADHTNFQTDHTNLNQDHLNLAADHANFQSDHTAFQADHTAFQGDHTDFQSDHADFVSDHADFVSDHSDFQTDHSNFQADHTNFQTDHTNLAADIVALGNENVDFGLNNADLAAEIVTLSNINNSLANAVSQVSGLGGLALAIADTPTLTFEIIDENGVLI